jgi:hypothetical protein
MTNKQLFKAIEPHRYVVVTNYSGATYAVNVRAAIAGIRIRKWDMRKKSGVASVRPCTFDEYIRLKIPFIVI